MKQKNLILIAVAVGCGLVAAILTSQMSAGQKKSEEFVEIPVASRDLPVRTKLAKGEIQNFVEYKKFSKDALPQEFAANTDEITDKWLVRTLRKGEPFNPKDLTTTLVIVPPPGFNVMTFSANAPEAVAGFAGPGSKVDILAVLTLRSQKGKQIVFPLFIDMLVLAIDTKTANEAQAIPSLSMVSVAVTPKQSLMLQGAITRGAQMRLVLRNQENPPVWTNIPTEEEIWKYLADRADGKGSGDSDSGSESPGNPPTTPKDVVRLPVPTETLPAGTQLTADVIESKFKMVEYTPPAPTAAVVNLREHVGKFLSKDVLAEQWLPRAYLSDKLEEPMKPAPTGEANPTEKSQPTLPETKKPNDPVKPPKVEGKKPVFLDTTIQGPNGIKKYRYQKLDNGEYKFLGIVREDGTVQEAPVPSTPPPAPAPAPAPAVPTEDPKDPKAAE